MRIKLLVIGKTNNDWLKTGIMDYINRLKHYINFELEEIPDIKNRAKMSKEKVIELESIEIIKHLDPKSEWIALDEHGKEYSSTGFSKFLEKKMIDGNKQLTFIVGGAFGISPKIMDDCRAKIALSQMTFSHQMVRLFIVEQLYRGFTIVKGEKYHHG